MERKEKGGKTEDSGGNTDARKGEARQRVASAKPGKKERTASQKSSLKRTKSAEPDIGMASTFSSSVRDYDVPSIELERAADYIAERFKEIGVETLGPAYKHPYVLQRTYLGEPNAMSIVKNGVREQLYVVKDFIPFGVTGPGKIKKAKLVFVGYGITAPEFNYDDYKNIDVRGKVVLALRGEPQMNDPASVFKGSTRTPFSYMNFKVYNAFKRGAVGFLYINDPVTSAFIMPEGFPWPSLYKRMAVSEMPLSLILKDTPNIPVVHVGEKTANLLFGGIRALKALQMHIDSSFKSNSYEIPDVTIDLEITTRPEKITANNVVGLIRGSGNTDEFVVIGAHYNQDIYDDFPGERQEHVKPSGEHHDGPGVAGILFLAEVLVNLKKRPKRNIVLVAFSCEKKGLYGTRAFMDSPPLPMKNCVAMINMDIIGDSDPGSESFTEQMHKPELQEPEVQKNNDRVQPFSLSYDIEDFFFSSDQPTYVGKKVPVLFYIDGAHKPFQNHEYNKKNHLPRQIEAAWLSSSVVWNIANMETYI